MKHGTGYIQFEDRSALNRLRLNEYDKADSYQIKDSAILWNESDSSAHVLGVWKRGILISSMRLELIKSKKLLEEKIDSALPTEIEIKYPVGILSKAVTLSEHRGHGLNAHLRYHLFNVAVNAGVQHIFGTHIKGAPRSSTLKDMGYKFYDIPLRENRAAYKSKAEVEIVFLDLAQEAKKAMVTCAKLASNSLLFYPWISPSLAKVNSDTLL